MEEQCSLNLYDLSTLLSTFLNVLACVVVAFSLVIVLYFVHFNRRWREGRMSGNISMRLQNNGAPNTSTSKDPAALVEALGIQDSMLQMNIGHSLSFHRNGSWLRSAQEGRFLSIVQPPPTNSLSSSSRLPNCREKNHKTILKPARLRLIKPNSNVVVPPNPNNEEWLSSNHSSSPSNGNHRTNRLACSPRNGYQSFQKMLPDKDVMNQKNSKSLGDSIQWSDRIMMGRDMGSEETESREKWKKGTRCWPSASVVVLLLLGLSITANIVFISFYISNQS